MKVRCIKLLLLLSLSMLSAAHASSSLLGCEKVIAMHDFDSSGYSKHCFNESLKKYHAKLDYKREAAQKISLPIIRNFIAARSIA